MLSEDRKLGQILIKSGAVSLEDIAHALTAQAELRILHSRGQAPKIFRLGEILLFSKKISLHVLHDALRQQTQKSQSSRVSAARSRAQEIKDSEVLTEDSSILKRLSSFLKWK